VRDNGIGLDTAFADKCFNLFDTAHPTAHEQIGMGIGLATGRIIVERHRGSNPVRVCAWTGCDVLRGSTSSGRREPERQ
jgi:light-regulated signal transduction histidine kinase (bacteriophytochrome)